MQYATPRQARGALNQVLSGCACGAQLRQMVQQGALEPFGVASALDVSMMDRVPDSLLCRWWALIHQAGMGPMEAGGRFGLGAALITDLVRVQSLYQMGPARDLAPLERQLCAELPFDCGEVLGTFAAVDPDYAAQPQLYRRLLLGASGDCRLAITTDQLLAAGVPECRLPRALNGLCRAVAREPKLNEPAALAALVQTMQQYW